MRFALRFPGTQIRHWAGRYEYEDDTGVLATGSCARDRGYFTRAELIEVCRWKTPRSQSRVASNESLDVEEITKVSLSSNSERVRIGVLTLLTGVAWPSASVLLHIAHRDPYPILDFRALWALGMSKPPAQYSFSLWWDYVTSCRELASKHGVDMRTLDRALWQYSKENQA